MKKFCRITALLSIVFTLGACQSIEYISIDYLVPSAISFPSQIKRVGIVNNMSESPDNTGKPSNDTLPRMFNEVARKTTYYQGDPVITSQSLAEAIADENYFDLVVICDSALRTGDIAPREAILSKNEVEDLASNLDVDLIIALENIQIQTQRTIYFEQEFGSYRSAVDAKVTPTIRIYLPSRSNPLVAISPSDNIFWEDFRRTIPLANTYMISDENVKKEASEFAGTIPVKQMIPYWKTGERYFFAGGSVDMRDAAIYARQNAWDKAFELWNKVYESKSKKKQMYAVTNIALYYEMQDNMGKAEEWARIALEMAKILEQDTTLSTDGSGVIIVQSRFSAIAFNYNEIFKRQEDVAKLRMQMDRFDDEN